METDSIEEIKDHNVSAYALPGVVSFSPQDLMETIACKLYGIQKEQLHKKGRKREIVEARQICMALYYHLYKNRGKSLTDAAKPYGKNHATVLHALKTIKGLIETQPKNRLVINYKETFFEFAKYEIIKDQIKNYELL